jgi:hypothetical protein
MRTRTQILTFLLQNFNLEILPSVLRDLAQEHICIPSFQSDMPKLKLAQLIFSDPQFPAIAELGQKTIATFLKVSQPLFSLAKAESQHLADALKVPDSR